MLTPATKRLSWPRLLPGRSAPQPSPHNSTEPCGAAFVDAPNGHIQGQPQAKYNGDPGMNCGQNDPYFVQGIFCQELAHTWGQGHHNQGTNGTCMSLNYFPTGTNYRVSDHDNADFNAIYGNHIP